MNLETIRSMDAKEMTAELDKMKQELFNLRFQQVTGQLENPVKIREVRRDIARLKTVIHEKASSLSKSSKEDN